MLRKFRVKNFLSFRDWQTLDLTVAANAPDLPGRFVQSVPGSKDRFPTFVAIFGANASGKTNILRAISFLEMFVRTSHQNQPNEPVKIIQFLGENFGKEATEFEVEFDAPFDNERERVKYSYRLVISPDHRAVLEEDLKYYRGNRPRRLFSRNRQEFDFGEDFKLHHKDLSISKIRDNCSVITILAQFNHPISTSILENFFFFHSNVPSIDADEEEVILEASFYYENSPELFEGFLEFSKIFDIGIEKIEFTSSPSGSLPLFSHRGVSHSIWHNLESHGTKRIFSLFPILFFAQNFGRIAFVDELDNAIHSLILPEIIDRFVDPIRNPNNAQLIAACQNPSILQYLEKEEVFFAEKGDDGATEIYGLKDVKGVRRESNIYANYLAGAFGGVPKVA